jgi:predicted Na+-dependent transporter
VPSVAIKNTKMNQLKRFAGILWIVLGPVAIYYLIKTAADEIAKKPVLDTKIQWAVFVVVFLPIAIGMVIFGWYALKGEYDSLPENSDELIN